VCTLQWLCLHDVAVEAGRLITEAQLQEDGNCDDSDALVTMQVPIGFDDLSAAVTLDLWSGQNLPQLPPAPPGTVCGCPAAPLADGTCADSSTMVASFVRQVRLREAHCRVSV
jgi:hypothetical protein